MPLYEYSCTACQKTFEVLQKFSDGLITSCPDCGGGVSKLISRTSFQLKGTGWYATDYKASSSTPPKAETPKTILSSENSGVGKVEKNGK